MRKTLAVLGVGNMGSAILAGILATDLFDASDVYLFDPFSEKCVSFSQKGCQICNSAEQAVSSADIVLLAVKPQQFSDLLPKIAPVCTQKLIISIAAGIPIERIRHTLSNAYIVRVMPNTPLQVGHGVSVLCRADNVSDEDYALARRIFSVSGITVEADESQINPVTALTSSSIAYFARFFGEMCLWAKENGFSDDTQTLRMICESAVGTAALLTETDLDPRSLERAVTSPGGTTQKAMEVFTENNLHDLIFQAMDACRNRADELSGC